MCASLFWIRKAELKWKMSIACIIVYLKNAQLPPATSSKIPATMQSFTITLRSIVVPTCCDIYSHKSSPLQGSSLLHSQIKRGQTTVKTTSSEIKTVAVSVDWLAVEVKIGRLPLPQIEGRMYSTCGLVCLIIPRVIKYCLAAFLLTGQPLWCPHLSPWPIFRRRKYYASL